MALPVSGSSWTTAEPIVLFDKSTGDIFVDPTIVEGDFQISVGGGALANMVNTPTVVPSGSVFVKLSYDATEMTDGGFAVYGVDSGGLWEDVVLTLNVPEDNDETISTEIGTAGAGLTDLGGMSTDMAEAINDEIIDVIYVDTIPELAQGVPAIEPTIATAAMLPYMTLRNEIDITNSVKEVHNDAGTIIATKATADDGVTYSEDKMVAGT